MAILDSLEKIAKIVSLIAVPIVVGVIGYKYQAAERDKSLALEYVKLSIDLVKDKEKYEPDVQDWAVANLNYYSQVQMTKSLQESLKKGTSSVDSSSVDSSWFAVIASVSTLQEAESLANDLRKNEPAELKGVQLGIYETKISKSYAVTVGRDTSRAEAFERTRIARKSGWVPDAFAQKNREWERKKEI